MHFGSNFQDFAIDFVTICKKRFPSSLRNIAPSGRPSPPGMRHVLAPSHMPIHTLQKSTRNDLYASSRPPQTIVTTKTTTYGCCLFGHWVDSPPLCLHRVLCLLGGPLDHGLFSLLLLRTGYVVCISARCRPPAVANFASHAAFRQSAP